MLNRTYQSSQKLWRDKKVLKMYLKPKISWTWKTDLWFPKGQGEAVGWTGTSWFFDANYSIWSVNKQ